MLFILNTWCFFELKLFTEDLFEEACWRDLRLPLLEFLLFRPLDLLSYCDELVHLLSIFGTAFWDFLELLLPFLLIGCSAITAFSARKLSLVEILADYFVAYWSRADCLMVSLDFVLPFWALSWISLFFWLIAECAEALLTLTWVLYCLDFATGNDCSGY